MKRMSAVLQKFQNHRLKKYLIEDEVVMSWLSWDLFVLSHPQYWQHVHIDVVCSQVHMNGLFLLALVLLIYPCYKFQGNALIERYFPYLAVGIFVVSLCRDAYIVGMISPEPQLPMSA